MIINYTTKDVNRFWSKVNKEGHPNKCWEWLAGRTKDGYGRLEINNKKIMSHRLSWILHNGKIPDGLFVLHKCDNPSCVNPDHLFLGTIADNNHDRDVKGRHVSMKGELHGNAQLTDQQVLEIRSRYIPNSKNSNMRSLAKEFGVNRRTIQRLIKGTGWRHLAPYG